MLWVHPVFAVLPVNQPVITSLSIADTDLVFNATFPAGVAQAVLEMRPALTDVWQPAASLEVPADGGTIEFSIPKPALESAFFRLNASLLTTANAQTNVQLSAELQYVTVPPLGPDVTNDTQQAEAVFHFKGLIDGSDRIVLTHQGAFWEHVNWSWPAGAVTVNGSAWNPSEKNYLTTTGAVAFLPEAYSLTTARLERIAGRDVIAMERTNNALIVYLDDTPSGAAPYEFKIHFRPAPLMPSGVHQSPAAGLDIAARIDGSDRLKITAEGAVWTHGAYAWPEAVSLNGVPWNVRQTNVLMNAGTNQFLPAGIDFSTARIVRRAGRDLATMWSDHDALWISFADNPNGAAAYELKLSFGP